VTRALAILALAAAFAAAGAAGSADLAAVAGPTAAAKCRSGYKAAVIAGKRTCLKAGQRCSRKDDKQLHRYGFHCHSGRLARVKPKPKPPAPPPLPGQKVDVGGYRLYIECIGSGTPAVIFEAGTAGGVSAPIQGGPELRATLGQEARVCAYDRAGIGRSDPRPRGVAPTGARFSEELHALLAGASVPEPYVLVGASFGGLVVMSHAVRYPAEHVGLVFLDSENPCRDSCVYGPPEAADFRDLGSPTFGDRPVVALTAEFSDGPDLARRSTNSILASAPGSTHFIVTDRPALVIAAVRVVIAAVRTGTKLPPCEQTPLPTVGGKCETFTP